MLRGDAVHRPDALTALTYKDGLSEAKYDTFGNIGVNAWVFDGLGCAYCIPTEMAPPLAGAAPTRHPRQGEPGGITISSLSGLAALPT